MIGKRFFQCWFIFCAAAVVLWVAFLIWAITRGLDILRLMVLA